jgi:hypothetical protein
LQYYDPLQLATTTIYNESNDATIAFLRHSEIKHGRIAMAAFVGYIVQANGIHFPWPMTMSGMPFPSDAGSPPEQWDALPDVAKVGCCFCSPRGKNYCACVCSHFPKCSFTLVSF